MIEIPILDVEGKQVGAEKLDPALLGGRVRHELLKQAVVAYRANQRQGTVATRSRAMVHGASRKLYRQKGTGRARVGNLRTPTRRGGGMAFHKINRDFRQKLTRKMRRLARNSAVLAKALAGRTAVVKGLACDEPKTARIARMLRATESHYGALLAVQTIDTNLQKSSRNIPSFSLKRIGDINAYDVLRARKLLFTPEAFAALIADPQTAGAEKGA